jgi:hypothetical protein
VLQARGLVTREPAELLHHVEVAVLAQAALAEAACAADGLCCCCGRWRQTLARSPTPEVMCWSK